MSDASRVELLHSALRAKVGSLFVQRQLLKVARITSDELFDMDVMAAAIRGGSEHEEDVVDGESVCAVCGQLDSDSVEADLYFHPVAALRAGIGRDED